MSGKSSYTCPVCTKPAGSGTFLCLGCKPSSWVHPKCGGYTSKEIQEAGKVDPTNLRCSNCKSYTSLINKMANNQPKRSPVKKSPVKNNNNSPVRKPPSRKSPVKADPVVAMPEVFNTPPKKSPRNSPSKNIQEGEQNNDDEDVNEAEGGEQKVKRGRGRPRKKKVIVGGSSNADARGLSNGLSKPAGNGSQQQEEEEKMETETETETESENETKSESETTNSSLFDVVKQGNYGLVQQVLNKTTKDVNTKDKDGWSCLHEACVHSCQFTKIAELLLQHGADPNIQDINGETPLHGAVLFHYTDTIKLLCQYNADIDLCNYDGVSSLDIAQFANDTEVLGLFGRPVKEKKEKKIGVKRAKKSILRPRNMGDLGYIPSPLSSPSILKKRKRMEDEEEDTEDETFRSPKKSIKFSGKDRYSPSPLYT